MKWILEDNGLVLTAEVPGGMGVIFKVTPERNGPGSTGSVHVGNTGIWPGDNQVFEVAAWHANDPPDSEAAKANAVKAFRSWAGAVMTIAVTDGHGNYVLELDDE